jgi:cellulose synthase/poly-beta-1,6-N-acetylglucosamine synthase-like glycosyltransferase
VTPHAVAIGIPARDEATRIEACIASIATAAVDCPLPISIVVAADTCRDDTARRASRALAQMGSGTKFAVIEVHAAGAGRARQAACVAAVARTERHASEVWLATTDADSTVAPDWLAAQLRWVARGVDGLAGLVRIAADAAPELRRRAVERQRAHGLALGHGHVHGANLALRADIWAAVGGFPPLAVGEDQALWRAARATGGAFLGVDDVVVTTSGRVVGRTPAGFARFLSELAS